MENHDSWLLTSKMEWCSRSNPRKPRILNRHAVFSWFVEYAWDEKHGVLQNVELTNWLKTQDQDTVNEFLILSNTMDYWLASWMDLTDKTKLREIRLKTARDFHNNRVGDAFACSIEKLFYIFFKCNDNLNYAEEDGRTILHIFLEDTLDITKNLSQEQLTRLKVLTEKLIVRGASFYSLDNNGKSPLSIAAKCKNRQILDLMISCMSDINACDENGNTVLHIVIDSCVDEEEGKHKDDSLEIVQTLVSKGADINVKNEKGMTAVHSAAERYNVEMLKYLADIGADFNDRANSNELPLFFACKSSTILKDTSKILETIDLLVSLQDCSVEIFDGNGFMPLHYATEYGRIEIVERFLELGVSVNCQTEKMLMTPLYLAAKSDRLDMLKKLVEVGANVNAETADGTTPIFVSALVGSLESMQFLIEQGADLYRRDKVTGWNLLHAAAHGYEYNEQPKVGTCERGHLNTTEDKKFHFLVKEKFDVNDAARCGVTPLQLAVLSENDSVVKTLIECGANVNFQGDESEYSALHIASIKKNVEIVDILIAAGADVNCKGGSERWTPLHLVMMMNLNYGVGKYVDDVTANSRLTSAFRAADPNHKNNVIWHCSNITETLIENGSDVDARDASGKTPLHFATLQSDSDLARILLETGAQLNMQDDEGRVPLSNALAAHHVETVRCLLDFGPDINDTDIIQQIMDSTNDQIKQIVFEHAFKLNLLCLPISKIYEPPIQQLVFTEFHTRCLKELHALKDHYVAQISLYQFLHLDVKRQYHLVEQICDSHESLERLFPIYFGIIRGAYHEAIHRKTLLESARIIWAQTFTKKLEDVCVERILSNINNRYLEVLTRKESPKRKIVNDQGKIAVCSCSLEIESD